MLVTLHEAQLMLNKSLKILYLAHRIPYPPNKGDKIRSFNEIKHLSKSHEIDLIGLVDNVRDLSFQKNLKKYCRKIFLLPYCSLVAKIHGLVYLASGKSISAGYFYKKKMQNIINKWCSNTDYDVVVCFSSSMAEYIFRSKILNLNKIQNNSHRPRLIMDFCDLDSDKWLQYSKKSKFPLSLIYRIENKRLFEYEKKINQNFDHSIFVSKHEANLFSDLYQKAQNITVITNGVDQEYFSSINSKNSKYQNKLTNLLSGPKLMFAGAMDYYANIDGVRWFCEKIFPIIKTDFSEVDFFIVGSNPTAEVKNLSKKNGVIVTGFVKDIRPYYNEADICVIPLRVARGIQNKVLESMAMGKAVVTTSQANQGINAIHKKHLMIADNADDFANVVLALLEDPAFQVQLGVKARQFVKENYNWITNMDKFDKLLGI